MTTMRDYYRPVVNQAGYVLEFPNIGDAGDLLQSYPPNPYAQSIAQLFPLGTKLTQGERVWRYCKNGAGTPAAGSPLQAAAASHADSDDDIAVGVKADIGDTQVSLTGTTNLVVAADYYKEGYLIINDGTGEGHCYKIKSHPAIANAVQCLVKIYDPIVIALVAGTSEVGLRKNPYDSVIATPGTAPTGTVIGVSPILLTASYYFWAQTGGPCAVIAQAAVPVGSVAVAGTQAAKAANLTVDATYGIVRTAQIIGFALTPGIADTESFIAFLTLDR